MGAAAVAWKEPDPLGEESGQPPVAREGDGDSCVGEAGAACA